MCLFIEFSRVKPFSILLGDKSRFRSLTPKKGEQTAPACENAWFRKLSSLLSQSGFSLWLFSDLSVNRAQSH